MAGRRQQGEGSVYCRKRRDPKTGRERVQWVAVADLGWKAGKRDRREFTGPDPKTALDKRDEFLDKRRDGFTLPRGRQPTVEEWVLHCCHHTLKKRQQRTTWEKNTRLHCESYIAPFFAGIPLANLQPEDVEDWHDDLLARPSKSGGMLKASTIGVAHATLSTCLKEAVARRRIPFNPCSLAPPPPSEWIPPDPPLQEELDAVLARCATWPNGCRWIVAVTTGIRQGEALALRWPRVRLKDPASVSVSKSLARVKGEWIEKDPKSRKGRRTVPLLPVAVGALKAHREAQEVRDIGGLVFTRADGRSPVHGSADRRDWHALLDDLGLPRYRVHDCRHAYATMLLEEGHDPRVVQDLMGWSSAAMAEVYQHVRPVMHARVVSSLDKRFGG